MKNVFYTLAVLVFVIAGIWGLVLIWDILSQGFGTTLAVVAMVFFPITFTIVPFYDLITNGNWLLLILTYGAGMVAASLYALGSALDSNRH